MDKFGGSIKHIATVYFRITRSFRFFRGGREGGWITWEDH